MPDPGVDDPLAGHRDRVMVAASLVIIPGVLAFVGLNAVRGRWTAAVLLFVIAAGVAADAVCIRLQRRPPIPFSVPLIPCGLVITYFLQATDGEFRLFWCFPAVLFFAFVFPRRVANACGVALLLLAAALAWRQIGAEAAFRFTVGLAVTLGMLNIIQSVIGDLQARLVAQSITDPLTGAFNRRHLETRIAEAIAARRRRNAPAALVLLDLDHFKALNDRFGHAAGDAVLRDLVDIIRRRVRALDHVFRVGGEEFVVLLTETDEARGVIAAEALRAQIERAQLRPETPVTVSAGVAGLRDEDSMDAWLKRADEALYEAKRAGRNRVVARAL
ncbi:MAG TPA: GGDEF domain-containing protein [Terriglobales bacterium]|nr:GGDEF domain-containing protein [Terriglobales bacterium]